MVIIQKGQKIRARLFHLGGKQMGAMEMEKESQRKRRLGRTEQQNKEEKGKIARDNRGGEKGGMC